MRTVIETLAVLAVIVYVVVRQFRGEPLRSKRVITLPLILTIVGAFDLSKTGHPLGVADVAFVAAGCVIAIGIGAWQGALMRLENRDGGLWGKMPLAGLWLWTALIVGRVAVAALAHADHAQVAASTSAILFTVGLNRLAQGAVVAARSQSLGVPFAAESRGSGPRGRMSHVRSGSPASALPGMQGSLAGLARDAIAARDALRRERRSSRRRR